MWDEYWKEYYYVSADACYFDQYAVSSSRWNLIISSVCLLASSSTVVLLLSSTGPAEIWGIILFLAQLVTVIRPAFPFEKRMIAANYIAKELHLLETEMKNHILDFTEDTPDEIFMELIKDARKRNEEIQFRFADSDTFPRKERFMEKAQNEAYLRLGGHKDERK